MKISGITGIDLGHLPINNATDVEVEGVLTSQGQNVSPFSGMKNYLINGNFDIWQRATSQTSSGYGSDDRWSNANIGSTKTHSQVATTDNERALFNASFFSRTVVTSVAGGVNWVTKYQHIENVTKLAGKTVTLSFWAKADSNKNIGFVCRQYFGTGGSPSSGVGFIGSHLFNLTSTWQKFTHTFTIPSIAGKTLGTDGVHTTATSINFGLDIGSTYSAEYGGAIQQSGTFDIAQVQLEEGSVATPFEQRPIGMELSLCQRYYQVFYMFDNILANQWLRKTIYLPTAMRVVPTIANLSSIVGGTSYTVTLGANNNTNSLIFYNSSATVGGDVALSGTASAEL